MKRVAFLDYLRVIAIFMVLVIHSCELYYFGAEGQTYLASRTDAFWVTFFEIVSRACVPLFVIASSYLLFPVSQPTGKFLKRRLLKVGVPFAFWCLVYTWWNGGEWGRMIFNFPIAAGGHLWFVPMLFGLYLLMPLLSAWAERVSEKELRSWLLVWLFTTTIPYLRWIFAAIYGSGWGHLFGEANFDNIPFFWGECPWNGFGTFHYVSGFFGYLLLGLWFRKFARELSSRKALMIAAPFGMIGALLMGVPFLGRLLSAANGSWPFEAPYAFAVELETPIEYCSLGVAAMVFAWFVLIRSFNSQGAFYCHVIRPLSEASFGVYLIHILLLVPAGGVIKSHLPTPLAIPLIAATTFVCSSILVIAYQGLFRFVSSRLK